MTESDAREEIMTATYEALCEHGYTDLTAQDIADRTGKSKSHLFYYYDSTEDLMVDFVDFLLERFTARVAEVSELPPVDRLATFVDWFLYGPNDHEQVSFHTALLELRAQAPYNDRFREQLQRSDELLRTTLEGILREGLETGAFCEHEPSETAALLIASFDGARVRHLTTAQDEYLEEVRSGAVEWILEPLLADGQPFPARSDRQTDHFNEEVR